MKKLNLFFIVFTFFFAGKMLAQGMMPPAPVTSPLLESMMGTWVSEPYEMMGSKMTDVVTHSMILNGQFLQIDVKSTADNGFVYEAKGMMSPDNDGNLSGWMFDIFGKNGITNYTGKAVGNMVSLSGSNDMMSEKREIAMDGDVMIHGVTFDMKDASGKAMPQQTIKITYNKQK
ncbi:MAG: hypothetical protein M3R36_13390 [Bacteroidota bacterium]|nr:hypothetical protein [Bacteroidota bacterium]